MNPITDIKEKIRDEYDPNYNTAEIIDIIIDRTALSVLDAVEGEIREREESLENGSKSLDEEGKLKTYERILECSSTRFRLQALKSEIEGKKGCVECNYTGFWCKQPCTSAHYCSACHLEGKPVKA